MYASRRCWVHKIAVVNICSVNFALFSCESSGVLLRFCKFDDKRSALHFKKVRIDER